MLTHVETDTRSPYVRVAQSVIVLTLGSSILYCIWHSPVDVPHRWAEWILLNVVALLVVPLGVVVCFMDDGLKQFGFRIGDSRRAGKWIVAFLLFMLPLLFAASRRPEFQSFYPRYPAARESAAGFLVLVVTIGIYMFCWEYFFRGFLLSGMIPGFGRWSVVIQAVPFGLSHWGNPTPELVGSFVAGVALGELAWRFKSFVPGFVIHWIAYVAFNAMVVLSG